LERQNNAFFILQRRNLSTADECKSSACCTISARYIRWAVQIGGGAHEIGARDAEAAQANTTDAEPICSAV
jgi:hypothetical protein